MDGAVARALLVVALATHAAGAVDYVGAGVCKTCHAAEFEPQSRTGHARALARSAAGQPGEWAFGAGVQAITFVSRLDRDRYLEHGESWYRALDGYGVTPGHRDSKGIAFRIFDPAALIFRCFGCHSTGPVTQDETDEHIVPHELGVRCEVCHGPGGLHAQDPARNRMHNPAAAGAQQLGDFCGKCHRLTLETGKEAFDLHDPRNARNEPLLLAASACFRRTKGGISCVACHSPHESLSTNSAAYDKVCHNCHAAPRHSHAVGEQACVACHMPAVRFENLAYRNHRIAAYTPADPMTPVSVAR
jgi:hypothetical protein